VILVDAAGQRVGTAPRLEVHTTTTPLHLAFSTYLFNARGEVLLTRRALGKKTWPGVWTNSCCGHPRPSESPEDAARRRIREELGLTVGPLVPLLPDFRYRAVDASGVVENEICPVYAGYVTEADPRPNPDEVAEWAWVPWDRFAEAITATPHVYSPWAALQVPLLVAQGSATEPATPRLPDVEGVCRDVDELLTTEVMALAREWQTYVDGNGVDVLPMDLPAWLGDLLVGRGKRLRVTMSYWGFLAAGGSHGSGEYRHLVRAAAALEALHLFALVHDDVMDCSGSRRGRPSAHVEAAHWHIASDGVGDAALFGTNIAVLLGDLAHTVADRIADDLPKPLRKVWYALCVELVAGQRADLTGTAAGRRDLAHADHVARLKSGRYSIERPLELGALAAGAMPDVVDVLLDCGEHIGRAFALRDDYLGVWGDPLLTGKPAGDDLLEAKATVLLTLARSRLSGHAAYLLARLGTSDVTPADIPVLVSAMTAAGVDQALEDLIAGEYDAAISCLDESALDRLGVAGIRDAARAIAWRDA
ncbi:MAG: isopentenyl-diphosphate Delta-isomerase, partial [Actinobacteria bacterium]|nr:isopentenyl-diphosphate Delta-isomerase [Actinomycetota bacterium]